MEKQVNNNFTDGSDRLILRLSGFDREWVRSASGEWVDLATLNQPEPILESGFEEPEEVASVKRWWKFW